MFRNQKMKKLLIAPIFALFLFSCEKHIHGCIDPLAINYNPKASCNDGSCVYSEDRQISKSNDLNITK